MGDVGKARIGGNKDGRQIFTRELRKWQKWMLMEGLSLTPPGFRDREIRRFAASNVSGVMKHLRQLFDRAAASPLLLIVKPINDSSFGQFPNVRVTDRTDLSRAESEVRSVVRSDTRELWVCATAIALSPLTFAGRLLSRSSPLRHEVIELVWGDSPRILNTIVRREPGTAGASKDAGAQWGGGSEVAAYARAERGPGEFSFRLTELRPGTLRISPIDAAECLGCVREHFRRAADAVEVFEALVERAGLTAYSMEFKFTNGHGVMIDWDTPADGRVLDLYAALIAG